SACGHFGRNIFGVQRQRSSHLHQTGGLIMSKVLPIEPTPAAAPFAIAAATVAVIGRGACQLAKKTHEKWMSISPEDRAYLLPFGAVQERQRLERTAINHRPVEAFEFEAALPNFGSGTGLPAVVNVETKELVFRNLEDKANEAGFDVKRRALPPGE